MGRPNKWTEEEIKLLKELVEKTTPYKEICRIMGRSEGSISNMVNKYKFQGNYPNNYKRKEIYHEYDWCYDRYINKRMTHQEMADELGVSKRVIRKWCVEKHKLSVFTIKEYLILNNIQKELILASLLGDGCISKSMFIVSHAENQKNYLFWKYEILKNLCNKKPKEYQGKIKKFKGNNYLCQKSYRVSTKIINQIGDLKNMSKLDIINQLNEFQLSIYLLDDGSRDVSKWQLCFASFNQDEKIDFINLCKNKFNLNCKINKCDDRYLNFDANSSRMIDNIILRNIPNELDIIQYKIINKKRNKQGNYVYVLKDDGGKVGISTYLNNKKLSMISVDFRQYLLKKNIKIIKEKDVIGMLEEMKNEK